MLFLNEKLLDKLKNKDGEVWVLIYNEYKSMVIKFARMNSGCEKEAEDLFQNVMISLLENIEKQKVAPDSNLKNYIYTLAKNQWFSKRRGKEAQVIRMDETIVGDEWVEDAKDTVDYYEKLDVILDSMKEKCKKIMGLRYFSSSKKSMAEIAEICGFSDARSATSQLNKCMTSAKTLALTL